MSGEPLAQLLPDSERLVFHGASVCIGQVRCPPTVAHFRDCGRTRTFCIVFPRSAVRIRRAGAPPYIEDAAVVGFYNREEEYERYEVSPDGDRCEWFAFSADVVRDAVGRFDPSSAANARRPLRWAAAPSTAAVYREQRILFEQVCGDDAIDPAYVEEAAIGILDRVISDAYGCPPAGPPSTRARGLAEAARQLIARTYARPAGLDHLAAALGTSVFHLCRVFRSVHRTTIHHHRSALRLRRAMELVAEPGVDVGQIAFDLGFSTHSHFTASFKRAFGATPSALRAAMAGCRDQKRSLSRARS